MSRGPDAQKRPKPTPAEQHARFVELARTVEVDESPDALDRAFERVIRTKAPQRAP
jgi:hypothetical protein